MTLVKRIFLQREYGVAALLLLMIAVVTAVDHNFLSRQNFLDILMATVPVAIVACGLTFVIVLGEIDISVGSLLGLTAVVLGLLTSLDHAKQPVVVGVAAVLVLGTFVGLVNGVLVVFGRVPSIIVTLGMLTALKGLMVILMNGENIQNLPDSVRFLGTGTLVGVPIPLLVAAVVIAFSAGLAVYTPLGRRLYAAGSNPHAAELAGLSVRGLKLFAFTYTGFLTAVAALVTAPRLSVIEDSAGKDLELMVVTAVVVGGTSLSGGRGTIAGSLLAAILLGSVSTALIFLKFSAATYWERAIQGGFILAAVLVDHLARRDGETP